MKILALTILLAPYVKQVRTINLKGYTRVVVEITEKVDFKFSANSRSVILNMPASLRIGKLKPQRPVRYIRIRRIGNRKLLIFGFRKIGTASFFTLPWPFKIIFDVKSKPESIERIIKYEKSNLTVVIDPGHGGKDPGAVHGRLKEKNITLAIARELKKLLMRDGRFDVILTRESDKHLELEDRTGISNAVFADTFISIHVNSSRSKSTKGIEVYYFSKVFTKHALKVAARENGIPLSKLTEKDLLLFELSSTYKYDESRHLARTIARRLGAKKAQGAPFYVLAGSQAPSVLVELGFISNPEDRKRLTSLRYRKNFAKKIYLGILDFFRMNPR